MTINEAISVVVKRRRIEIGLSQDGLTIVAGVSGRQISNIERCVALVDGPNIATLEKVSRGLELKLSELIALAEAESAK